MRAKRLWWRLFISYLWVPVVVLLLVGWYGSDVVERMYEDQLKSDLEARARLCEGPVLELLARGEIAGIDTLCKALGRSSHARVTVVLPSGQVVGDSDEDPADMDNHGQRPEILTAFHGKVGHSRRYSSTEKEDRIYVAVSLSRSGAPAAVVRTSFPVTALTRTMRVVRHRIVLAAIVGVLLHGAITLAISRRMSRPLEEIKAGAERFAAGDLRHRLQVPDSVEIGALAQTMNRMAEQLDERIQTALRQQNERDAMLSSMEEGVMAIDNNGTILSVNKACAALLGEHIGKLQGRDIRETVHETHLLKFVDAALASASPVEEEIRVGRAPDRWVSARGTVLLDSHRGKIGVLIVLHDVTRLRHLEEVRRDFVANVSHELRTPITSIKGFMETLLEGALEDRENARRFLEIMARQVNRLDAIIGDLLALSRIERSAEEQWIELAAEPVQAVLQAAVETCQRKATEKRMRIEMTCPADLTAEINATLLEQAVANLLDNAFKYSNPEAAIEIHAAREGPELVICIKDHGWGIEAQYLPRLFERFYRVDKARSRELGGTGLGLAIVRHIALAHRGSVSVESTVGLGSTFCLRLPACPTSPSASSPNTLLTQN